VPEKRTAKEFNLSSTAKLLGIAIPVLISSTFCLSVPFIIIVADIALLTGAIVAWMASRSVELAVPEELFGEVEDTDPDPI
jgi:hypothetical protein